MAILLTLLIVTAPVPASTESPAADAVQPFVAGFEAGEDQDFDLWPDGWTRRPLRTVKPRRAI